MPITRAGAESSCRRSTSANRQLDFYDCGRMGTARSSSRYSAGLVIDDERILCRAASALASLDIGDDVFDGADFLGVLVGNLDVEFLFQRHHQLDDVERVRAEILDKRGLRGYFVGGHAQLLADFLANFGFDILSHRALVPPGSAALRAASIFQYVPRAAEVPRASFD